MGENLGQGNTVDVDSKDRIFKPGFLPLGEGVETYLTDLNKHLDAKLDRPCSYLVVFAVFYWHTVD